jgi:hypothetical protein
MLPVGKKPNTSVLVASAVCFGRLRFLGSGSLGDLCEEIGPIFQARALIRVEETPMKQGYDGRNRRRHSMYVTRNTEYHFRDAVCVAVRDLHTGRWLPAHLAVSRRLTGGLRLLANGAAVPTLTEPAVGEALYFGENGRELITSLLSSVERPPRDAVAHYASA